MRQADVTVFGGTGFLGRRIVECLVHNGLVVRVAVRHPDYMPLSGSEAMGEVEPFQCDIRDSAAVRSAVAGSRAAINAVSLYTEHDGLTFESVHVRGASNVAMAAAEAGLQSVVHVSGIGADPDSRSSYIRNRGRGEAAVRDGFPAAFIVRPTVMFGPGDSFLNVLVTLVRRLPVIPLFGKGETRLQPIHVDDVAEAVSLLAVEGGTRHEYELGGPDIYAYADLLRLLMKFTGKHRKLVELPFPVWSVLAFLFRALPRPPVTATQVALMRRDNVVANGAAGLADLGIDPVSIPDSIHEVFRTTRAAGQRPRR